MSEPNIEIMSSPAESIYAEFGATNAVISGDLSEHEQSMLQLDTAVRDGDDAILLDEPEDEDDSSEPQETEEEDNDSNDQDDFDPSEEPEWLPKVDSDSDSGDDSADEETETEAEPTDDLTARTQELKAQIDNTNAILAEAIDKGLPPEMESRINEEYLAGEGFSQATYDALAEVGYSKTFVDTFVAAQEALAEKFTASVVSYAGGQAQFDKAKAFMVANMPSAVDVFNNAIDANDAAGIKFVLDQAKEAMGKKYGTRPSRKPAAQAKQATPKAAPAVEPFEDREAMIKAMSDRRYSVDPKYRAAVEARVLATNY